MKHRSLIRCCLLSATTLAGLASVGAQAQDMASAEMAMDAADDVIIVTGTRRSVSLQDAPINITAVGAEQLQDQRIDDVRDLAAFTPGVTVLDTGPRSTGTIVLRGLSAADTSAFGSNRDTAVATYIGEVPLYQDLKFLDIERVETLLGPQGTLYGAGTLAGAIRYLPNRPNPSEWEGNFRGRMYDVAHANSPGFTVDGTINIPIIRDKLAFRSTAGYYDDPGFIDYVALLRQPGISLPQPAGPVTSIFSPIGTPEQIDANLTTYKDANYERTFSTRNSLGLFPTETINIYLNYTFQQTKTNGRQANSAGAFGTGIYEAAQRYLEPSDRKTHLVSGEMEIELGGFAQLVSATAYSEQTIDSSNDVTDLLLDLDYGYELYPQFSGFTRSRVKYKQFNQELRLVSAHGGPLSWVIGGFYNKLKTRNDYREITPGLPEFYFGEVAFGPDYPEPIEYISYIDATVTEKAIFGEGTFEITPQWQVTAGARYFKYDSVSEGSIALPLLEAVPAVVFPAPGGGEAKDDGVVWKFNTSYKFSDDIMVYGTYSKGYRIGGPNRVAPCNELGEQQSACALPNELFFGPDTTKNKEIGIRAQFFDRKLTTNLAVYHIDWSGIQLASQTENGSVGITANGGSAVSKGVEFNFSARPVSQLTINGTYSYNDSYLTEDVPGLLTVRNQVLSARPKQIRVDVLSGDRLPGTPRHSGSLGATFAQPLANGAEIITNWTATYQGNVLSRVGARAGGEKIPDYTVHRASITYSTEKWDVRVFADNIFDNFAVASVGEDLSRRIINSGVVSRYYSQVIISPRKIGIETAIRF